MNHSDGVSPLAIPRCCSDHRLLWLDSLTLAVRRDVESESDQMLADGWSAADTEGAIRETYGPWITGRIGLEIDSFLISRSWSITTTGTGS